MLMKEQMKWLILSTCTLLMVVSNVKATEESSAGSDGSQAAAAASSHHESPGPSTADSDDSDWEYLRRFYEPAEKRAYSYVSEFKRLPVYNFGLGKRSGNDGRLYSFGLGKREKGMRQYSFGLGKRPSNGLYSFGLGKRSMDYSDDTSDDLPEDMFDDSAEDEMEEPDDLSEEKRGGRQYGFGLGKRYSQRGPYSFGLGKRGGSLYSFGLGKRAPKYSFGLGKRLPNNRQYSFGLGKREITASELAAVAAESAAASSTSTPARRRRSVSSGEQVEWADAETPRPSGPQLDERFGRASRPYLRYAIGLGKRQSLRR